MSLWQAVQDRRRREPAGDGGEIGPARAGYPLSAKGDVDSTVPGVGAEQYGLMARACGADGQRSRQRAGSRAAAAADYRDQDPEWPRSARSIGQPVDEPGLPGWEFEHVFHTDGHGRGPDIGVRAARRRDHQSRTAGQCNRRHLVGTVGIDDDQTRTRPDGRGQFCCLDRPGENSGGGGKA